MIGKKAIRRVLPVALLAGALTLVPAAQASAFEHLRQYGIGYPESGNGQIVIPLGVAVAPDGTVVATDTGSLRVSVFSQSGKFLRAFGKDVSTGGGVGPEVCVTDCKAGMGGSAGGELESASGVVATASEIYVSEIGNNRISVFAFDGRFLRAFGADVGGPGVNVCTTVCATGTAGSGAGQMAGPAGLALDAAGKLYVTELGTARVDVFDPLSGAFQSAFGKNVGGPGVNSCTASCQSGVSDATPGSINGAYSLDVAPGGEVFVAEVGTSRVSVFAPGGQFLRSFGEPGTGAGQLDEPFGVALDGLGAAFVSDSGNDRLSTFGEGGAFAGAYGLDVVPGLPAAAELCTTVCQPGSDAFGLGGFVAPRGIDADCRGAIYVGGVGRIDKWGESGVRTPPCPSNAFTIGRVTRNKKRGTVAVEVTVPGPGSLVATVGKKLGASVPQPDGAGTLLVTVKAAGKGVKTLARKGKLRGTLVLTFTPPNGDPNAQSRALKLTKKLKKKKKAKRGKAKSGKPKSGGNRR